MKVPTIEDFLNSRGCSSTTHRTAKYYYNVEVEYIAELIKLHLKEALKQASENFKMKQRDNVHELDMNDDWMEVDKESILNAYPIDEII